ncbi:hypothetical protein HMPREF9374_2045 [Desmospora sp. 8437]|nr:hypothetical protein HMPREF9374_2045 [Desmospora sp. 8437]
MTAAANPNLIHFIMKYLFPTFPFIAICYMIKKELSREVH